MRSLFATIRNFIIPAGSPITAPRFEFLTGQAIPAELLAAFPGITSAFILRTSATQYTYMLMRVTGLHIGTVVNLNIVDTMSLFGNGTSGTLDIGFLTAGPLIQKDLRTTFRAGAGASDVVFENRQVRIEAACILQILGGLEVNGISQPRGRAGFVASAAGVLGFAAETTILNTGNVTFVAGRAYEIRWELDATSNAAYVDSVWHLRRTNIAGALLRQAVGFAVNNTDAVTCGSRAVVRNDTGADIVTPVLLTGSAPLGGALSVRGLAAAPYYLEVTDIGLSTSFPNVVQV
jgi:hypothetical protein